jgi:hypothetical protein
VAVSWQFLAVSWHFFGMRRAGSWQAIGSKWLGPGSVGVCLKFYSYLFLNIYQFRSGDEWQALPVAHRKAG